MFVEIVVLLIGLCVGFYLYNTRNFGYWKKRGIPYVKPIPIFGNLYESAVFRKNAGLISADAYRQYPNDKVVGMFHFDTPVLLVRDPQLIYKIFVTDFTYFSNNGITIEEHVDPVFSRNMFFQKDDKWKRTRQMLSPAFTVGKIRPVFDQIIAVGKKLKDFVAEHPEECEVRISLKYLMSRYTSEIVASCGLGIDGHSFVESKPQLVRIGQLIFEPGFLNGIIQFIVLMAPTISKLFHIKMVPKQVPRFFNQILHDVIKQRQTNPSFCRPDLMQYWIELKRKSEDVSKGNVKSDVLINELSNDDILSGCITFFIEGYETSSMVTSFALYYLALNKDIQDRVKSDIDDLYARTDGKLTYEAVNDMNLLNNIVLEVLRLHPALIHAFKTCTKTYSMDIGKPEPLIIERDTIIVIPNIALSNDPKYWKNPEKFNPDRFDDMDKDEWRKGVFFPFGEGPRICIGMRMAYAIVKMSLIQVIKDFEVVPTTNTPTKIVQDPRHFISRNRTGLFAKFVKRS